MTASPTPALGRGGFLHPDVVLRMKNSAPHFLHAGFLSLGKGDLQRPMQAPDQNFDFFRRGWFRQTGRGAVQA